MWALITSVLSPTSHFYTSRALCFVYSLRPSTAALLIAAVCFLNSHCIRSFWGLFSPSISHLVFQSHLTEHSWSARSFLVSSSARLLSVYAPFLPLFSSDWLLLACPPDLLSFHPSYSVLLLTLHLVFVFRGTQASLLLDSISASFHCSLRNLFLEPNQDSYDSLLIESVLSIEQIEPESKCYPDSTIHLFWS